MKDIIIKTTDIISGLTDKVNEYNTKINNNSLKDSQIQELFSKLNDLQFLINKENIIYIL